MISKEKKPKGYWNNKANCMADAALYSTRSQWIKASPSAYNGARRLKCVDECCAHMIAGKKPNGTWNRTACIADAKKYSTQKEWRKVSGSGYSTAAANKWMDVCCAHMTAGKKANGTWTKRACMKDAKRFNTRTEWRDESVSAYTIARRSRWLHECCAHMERLINPNGHWTKSKCIEDAAQYGTVSEWMRADGAAIDAARANGWIEVCCAHMISPHVPRGHWSKANCLKDAAQYQTITDWKLAPGSGYDAAYANGWKDECCAHMVDGHRASDSVYIWKAVREFFNGKPVYKFGVTGSQWGDSRIKRVSKDAEIVVLQQVGNCREVEKLLLSLGDDPKFVEGDGRTEYRALSKAELAEAIDLVMSDAVETELEANEAKMGKGENA